MSLPTFRGSVRLLKNLFRRDKDRFLWQVPGVVHVGASFGQERLDYADKLLAVVWIEPHPKSFAELQRNIRPFPEQIAISALVTSRDGERCRLNLSEGSGAASSILPLKEVHAIWPDVRYEASVELETTTLPTLLRKHRIIVSDYPALVMDTQGSELLVLQGAENILKDFVYIKTEVPDFEAYQGCARLTDISEFLHGRGFVEESRVCFASAGTDKSYYDVVYRRRDFRPVFPCRLPLRRPPGRLRQADPRGS